jgi:hypothetical protein
VVVGALPVDSRPARFMTWMAVVIVLATGIAYSLLTRSQRSASLDVLIVPFVTAYIFLMAALLALSLTGELRAGLRMPMRAAAAGGLLVLGILSLFSIGLPLVVSGALATGATVRALREPRVKSGMLTAAGAAVLAVALLVAGFEGAERYIVCPSTGSAGGAGAGLVSGPYYYDCIDGRLSFHSGSCSSSSVDANGHVLHPGC